MSVFLDQKHRASSSVSLLLVGDNTLVHTLRILTSLELFMNAQFYCDHPCFSSVIDEHPECFGKSVRNLLPLSVSFESLDTGSVKFDLVKQEAISNCNAGKWSSFLCIMGILFYKEISLHITVTVEN